MKKLIEEFTPDELQMGLDSWANRERPWSRFTDAYEASKQETESLRQARDLFITESVQNILTGRANELGMADADYSQMIKNAALEAEAAEKFERMLQNKINTKLSLSEHIGRAAEGIGEFATDVIMKSPKGAFAKKVGQIVGKIFGKLK